MSTSLTLNEQAQRCADQMMLNATDLRIGVQQVAGANIIDCGAGMPGGIHAGLQLARLCLAGRAEVALVPGDFGPAVQVTCDDPVRACLASQYAGWQIKVGKYFAMGSGPMRAIYAKEPLFQDIPGHESAPVAVGVLETRKAPDAEVISYLAERLPQVERITLAYAPAASIAGTIQVVARALETALHKLHELKFNLSQIISGAAVAPLPPVAGDEMQAIGRTNDAILYGARVTLWLRGDDHTIASIGSKVPSNTSADYGLPFADILGRYGDFYKIDPMLFSPAEITFINIGTGQMHRFGQVAPSILAQSFGG